VEETAYFVASEALTNIAEHSAARSSQVTVSRTGSATGPVLSSFTGLGLLPSSPDSRRVLALAWLRV